MPVVTIVAGIIAAGATVTATALNVRSQRKANEQNLGLANVTRDDTLKQQAETNRANRESLALSKQSLAFQREQDTLNREERKEDRGYSRMQNAANKYSEYLNQKTVLTGARMSPMLNRGIR